MNVDSVSCDRSGTHWFFVGFFAASPSHSRFYVFYIQRCSSACLGCNENENLSYCCVPISLKQSGHSPLSSGINKAFLPRKLMGYFFGLFPKKKNLEMAVWENLSRSTVSQ